MSIQTVEYDEHDGNNMSSHEKGGVAKQYVFSWEGGVVKQYVFSCEGGVVKQYVFSWEGEL